MARVIVEKCNEYLKYTFSEDELSEKGRDVARAVSDKEQAEDKMKSVKKQIDSEIADADGKIRKLSEHIRSGYEMRYIDCECTKDFDRGIVSITRLDTGEVVRTRSLREDELQQPLI